jgi:hypothetical protein
VNEIERVSEMRVEVPVDIEARLAAVRGQLVEAIAGSASRPAAHGTHRPGRRLAGRHLLRPRLAASIAAALAILAIGVARSGQHAAIEHSAGGPPAAAIASYRLTAHVLRAASLSAASRPTTQPAGDEWIYTKVVDDQPGAGTSSSENWIRFDGTQEAYMQGAQLVVHVKPVQPSRGGSPLALFADEMTPASAYAALASLPTQPQALLDAVDATVAAHPQSVAPPGASPLAGATRQQLEFDFLTELMWNAAQASPPAADAAVFRALATIPGATAQPGATDAAGRPAISLSDTGTEQQLLLDPGTYQVTGLRVISNGHQPRRPDQPATSDRPVGALIDSLAYETIAVVGGPGQRGR